MADVKKRYDWSYYSTISTLPDGWTSINDNRAVVLNDEIHVIFDGKHHYKWTGSEWVSVSTLPYDIGNGSNASGFVIVLNNEIHALGLITEDGQDSGKGHYAWDGQNWREVSVLPEYFNFQGVVVYNGEIHLLGGPNASSHIKFNGSSWEEVSTLPEDVPWCQAIVCGGKIHVLNSDDTKHWAFDGTSWAEVSTLPYYTGGSARVVTIDDEIHIFSGSDDWYTTHYRWDGTKWIDTSIIPYYLGVNIASTVVYNGVIYGISDNAMYSIGKLVDDNDYDWDDIESLGDLPYDFVDGCVLKYNDEIHILGSSVSGNETKHYKYDGSNFYEVSTLPYPFYKGSAVIYGGVINILGGEEGPKNWYKFNGTSWESSVELPFDLVDGMAYVITGFDYNDLNDEQLQIVVGTDKYAGIHTSEDQWSVYTYDNVPAPVGKNSILLHNLQKHILSGTYHYKYDGVWWLSANKNTLDGQSWDSDSALPYDFHNGAAVSINGDIHILGSDTSGNGTKHYSWNSSTLTWEELSSLPYDFHNGAAIVYDDEVYIFGGTNNAKGFTKIGSIVKPDPPTPPTPPDPPVPDTDYEYLNKEGLKHLIDLIKSDSVATYIGSFEKDVALYDHSARDILYFKDGFYKATTPISEGDTIAVGLNIVGAGLDAGTVVYIWGFPNNDEKYNAVYMVNEDGTGTEYANNLIGSAEPAVDKTYTIKLNLADQNPDTWCTRVEGNVTEIGSGMTENEIDDFMGYYPCMLLNGVEGKRLNPDNYAQDLNGVPVDIVSGAEGDAMVNFPARGYKISKSGDEITISITKERNKIGYTYPTYNGKSVKSFYESAYEGYVNDGVLASLSGQNPTTNKKIGEFRDATGTTTKLDYDWSLSPEGSMGLELVPDSDNIISCCALTSSAVEYDGFVHIFGCNHQILTTGDNKTLWNEHFRFNENNFEGDDIRLELVSELPFEGDEDFASGQPDMTAAVVYDDKIHLFYSYRTTTTFHGVYDGTSWDVLQDVPPVILHAVVYNGEIHALAVNVESEQKTLKHVKFNGSSWEDINEFQITVDYLKTGTLDVSRLEVYDEKIHFIQHGESESSYLIHHIYDGYSWSSSTTQIETGDYPSSSIIKLSGTLYLLNGIEVYKYIDNTWVKCADISHAATCNRVEVTLNGRFYEIGGISSGYWDGVVKIIGDTATKKYIDWDYIKRLNDLPINAMIGSTHVVVVNDEIHMLGGVGDEEMQDDQYRKHYKWDGTNWIEMSTLPGTLGLYGDRGWAVCLNGCIHIAVHSVEEDEPNVVKQYKWDGTEWTIVSDENLINFLDAYAFVYENTLYSVTTKQRNLDHYIYSEYDKLYRWDGSSWSLVCDIPQSGETEISAISGCIFNFAVYRNDLYLIRTKCDIVEPGNQMSWNNYRFEIYKFNGNNLEFVFQDALINYGFEKWGNLGTSVSFPDGIHIFTGALDNSSSYDDQLHFLFDGERIKLLSSKCFPNLHSSLMAKLNDGVYVIGRGAEYNEPSPFFYKFGETISKLPYEQLTFNALTYLQCCAIIKYKGRNMRQVLGMGHVNGVEPLQTGSMNTRGLNWGEQTGKYGMKLFGIENMYGNLDKFVDGIVIDSSGQILTSDGNFNDNGDGYNPIGQPLGTNRILGFLKDIIGVTGGGFVSNGSVGGSDTTYFCDFTEIYPDMVATYGGNLSSGSLAGLTNLSLNHGKDDVLRLGTARLTYFKPEEIIEIPTPETKKYTYTGLEQTFSFSSIDSSNVVVLNDHQTNAGTYIVKVELKSSNYYWSDMTTGPKTFTWTIDKANQTISASTSSITLTSSSPSAIISIYGANSELKASEISVATTTINGNAITITGTSMPGSETLSISAKETINYKTSNVVNISVTSQLYPRKTFAAATVEEIKAMVKAADKGEIDLYEDCGWRVGQENTITLPAIEATGSYDGVSWSVYMSQPEQEVTLVLVHKGLYDLVTPVKDKSGASRTKCSFVVMQKNALVNGDVMNKTNTNSGSWGSSERRKWCNGGFRLAMESVFGKDVWKKFITKTAETYEGTSLQTVEDYFAIPAAAEIFKGDPTSGTGGSAGEATAHSNLIEFNALTRFTYFETTSNRLKKQGNTDTNSNYIERSPTSDELLTNVRFCFVNPYGNPGQTEAYSRNGIVTLGCL